MIVLDTDKYTLSPPKSNSAVFEPEDSGGNVVGTAPLDGAGAGGFHQLFRQNVGLFCLGSGEFQLLHHPAGAVHQEAV